VKLANPLNYRQTYRIFVTLESKTDIKIYPRIMQKNKAYQVNGNA